MRETLTVTIGRFDSPAGGGAVVATSADTSDICAADSGTCLTGPLVFFIF